jgi:hypothetical protein
VGVEVGEEVGVMVGRGSTKMVRHLETAALFDESTHVYLRP